MQAKLMNYANDVKKYNNKSLLHQCFQVINDTIFQTVSVKDLR